MRRTLNRLRPIAQRAFSGFAVPCLLRMILNKGRMQAALPADAHQAQKEVRGSSHPLLNCQGMPPPLRMARGWPLTPSLQGKLPRSPLSLNDH